MASRVTTTAPRTDVPAGEPAERVARLACEALVAEADLTPKPGLVDRRGSGAHADLSFERMRLSAAAIEPYFYRMALTARAAFPSQALRERLALLGRQAEQAMLQATRGSNAHKGAIWALGLLVSAWAMQADASDAAAIAGTAGLIAAFEDRAAPRLVSHGDTVARRYGVVGARGEARGGFPHVIKIALPTLRRRRAERRSEAVARLDALLGVMARLDDTCLLYRGGRAGLTTAQHGALSVERAGGVGTGLGWARLRHLDRCLLARRLSPGGSADLLAATLFLDALEYSRSTISSDCSLSQGRFDGAH